MAESTRSATTVRFGVFEADLQAGQLRRKGRQVRLQEQPFQVLALLLERPGEVVPREVLRERLWPADTFVEFDHSLNTAVSKIREALGDSADNPRFVETLPRRGYRFIAPVELPTHLARVTLLVLPLDNLSGDPEQDYFCDGLTEEMISSLGRLHPQGLGVIARTSAMQYKHSDKPLPQIARELGVDYIVEGSVRRQGQQVRVTAQLIQASDQVQLWSQTEERKLEDVLALQEEFGRRIASSLALELLPSRPAPPAPARSLNPEAYEAYLKGRHAYAQFVPQQCLRAIEYLHQAVELDPGIAPAQEALGRAHVLAACVMAVPSRQAIPRSKAALARALELDPNLAEAHAQLAFNVLTYECNFAEAERGFKRALELNPNSALARYGHAMYLAALGCFEEALAEIELARRLDPLSALINTDIGLILRYARRYDLAEAQLERIIEMHPHFASAHHYLEWVYQDKKAYEQAFAQYLRVLRVDGAEPEVLADRERLYSVSGWSGIIQEQVRSWHEWRSRNPAVFPYFVALAHARADQTKEALAWLEEAYREEFHPLLCFANVEPVFVPLRDDPRFQLLLRRMNFPE